jgi:F-type H+-transporting ATPase subunit b
MMDYDAEFFVLLGFLVFVGVLIYFGAHRMVLKALDARGEAIGAELAQAAKLRQEATSLLASFEKKSAEAQASAEVRAAAAEHAAKAAEIVLTDQMKGSAGADLVAHEISEIKSRLS